MAPVWYTVKEFATMFLVSTQTVRNLCRKGKLAGAVRIGRQFRIPKTAPASASALNHKAKPLACDASTPEPALDCGAEPLAREWRKE